MYSNYSVNKITRLEEKLINKQKKYSRKLHEIEQQLTKVRQSKEKIINQFVLDNMGRGRL